MTGVCVCLIGALWPEVWGRIYFASWPLAEAITIAWATVFPDRVMLLYFVLPVGGRKLVYLTVAGTLVFALLYGFALFLPHFLALGLTGIYLRGFSSWQYWWLRLRVATRWPARRRPSHLRPVKKKDWTEPPTWLH